MKLINLKPEQKEKGEEQRFILISSLPGLHCWPACVSVILRSVSLTLIQADRLRAHGQALAHLPHEVGLPQVEGCALSSPSRQLFRLHFRLILRVSSAA